MTIIIITTVESMCPPYQPNTKIVCWEYYCTRKSISSNKRLDYFDKNRNGVGGEGEGGDYFSLIARTNPPSPAFYTYTHTHTIDMPCANH